jgi:hypothetical protein
LNSNNRRSIVDNWQTKIGYEPTPAIDEKIRAADQKLRMDIEEKHRKKLEKERADLQDGIVSSKFQSL